MNRFLALMALSSIYLVLAACSRPPQPPAAPLLPPVPPAGQPAVSSFIDPEHAQVIEPAAGAEISGPVVHVAGKVRTFEANLFLEVRDGNSVLVQKQTTASTAPPEWGDFAVDLEFAVLPADRNLTLILFDYSAKDGTREEYARIPLHYTGQCPSGC